MHVLDNPLKNLAVRFFCHKGRECPGSYPLLYAMMLYIEFFVFSKLFKFKSRVNLYIGLPDIVFVVTMSYWKSLHLDQGLLSSIEVVGAYVLLFLCRVLIQ